MRTIANMHCVAGLLAPLLPAQKQEVGLEVGRCAIYVRQHCAYKLQVGGLVVIMLSNSFLLLLLLTLCKLLD